MNLIHTIDSDLRVGLLSEIFLRARRNIGAVGHVSTYTSVMGTTGNTGPVEVAGRVSTHAPVMGATTDVLTACCDYPVSTHAPVMGATAAALALAGKSDKSDKSDKFQPTRP